ncbi:MAG: type I-E CRISPR-associated protein Cas7/Cse4/CasC [Gammaproteobacteria bacterium]|nr:type I-E CRISPR-associated protein Cas7/Cse4/CasC [Gammaproteobacteria bacterium]
MKGSTIMLVSRFLQIHSLHSYPAALLNRDDSGLAKRMPFGGAVRTRISSQCLKRHWRTADDDYAIHNIPNAAKAIRSRNVIDRKVIQPLREGGGIDEEVLSAVEEAFNIGVYGSSGTSESGRQPLLLGLPEVSYLRDKADAICRAHAQDAKAAGQSAKDLFGKEERDNFKAFRQETALPGGLESALFGRMVTSDPAANIDAAVHVAHAFTVHREESESDYFSVVDDLQGDDEDAGAAHIGDTELTAGLFYGYVVVDVPGLISNLQGCEAQAWQSADRSLGAQVVKHLIHLIATVSPGAKLGSTAPYSYADLILIEIGTRQPRSLANAFRSPSSAQTAAAAAALAGYLTQLDNAYGVREARRVMSVADCDIPNADRLCLDDLAAWTAGAVQSGEAA